jgi:hypothetical protein
VALMESEHICGNFYTTLQPIDLPPEQEQDGLDNLVLYACDFPSWHHDEPGAFTATLPESLSGRVRHLTAAATYGSTPAGA